MAGEPYRRAGGRLAPLRHDHTRRKRKPFELFLDALLQPVRFR
jgi:hypothetical protein